MNNRLQKSSPWQRPSIPHHLFKVVNPRKEQSMNSSPQRVCLYSTDTSSFSRLKLVASQHSQLPLRPPTILFPSWPTWLIKAAPGSADVVQALLAMAFCHHPLCFPSFYRLHSFLFATTLVLSPLIPPQSSTSSAFLLARTSFFSHSSAHLSPVLWHRLEKKLCASRK